MFGLFRKRDPWTNVEVPNGLYFNQSDTMRALASGFDLQLKPEVQEWFKEHRIKVPEPRPSSAFGKMLIGRPIITLRERDAVFFKMRWH